MVKVHKMFCIDAELVERLKGVNASELVNRLLENHVFGGSNKEDLEKAIIERDHIIEKANKEIKDIKTKISKVPKFISRSL